MRGKTLWGESHGFYHALVDGAIQTTDVLDGVCQDDGTRDDTMLCDEGLTRAYYTPVPLAFATPDDIAAMGWDVFVASCGC